MKYNNLSTEHFIDSLTQAQKAIFNNIYRLYLPNKLIQSTGVLYRGVMISDKVFIVRLLTDYGINFQRNLRAESLMGDKITFKDFSVGDKIFSFLTPNEKTKEEEFEKKESLYEVEIGSEVETWGYPKSNEISSPRYLEGYISGIDIYTGSNPFKQNNLKYLIAEGIENAGSGWPVLDKSTKELIGITSHDKIDRKYTKVMSLENILNFIESGYKKVNYLTKI